MNEEQFDEKLDSLVDLMGIESLFPKDTRIEDYKPYFNSEDTMQQWVTYPYDREGLRTAAINILFLENLLSDLESKNVIEYYEKDGAEYKVRAARYDIHLRVLHFGDVVQYTVNRKTNNKANYAKGMMRYAIKNNLMKYV